MSDVKKRCSVLIYHYLYQEAEIELRDALNDNADFEFVGLLAASLIGQLRYDEARIEASKVPSDVPNGWVVHAQYAWMDWTSGNTSAAVKTLKMLYRAGHRDFVLQTFGDILLGDCNYKEAILAYKRIDPSSPQGVSALAGIAMAYTRLRNQTSAEKYLQSALSQTKDNTMVQCVKHEFEGKFQTRVSSTTSPNDSEVKKDALADPVDVPRPSPRDLMIEASINLSRKQYSASVGYYTRALELSPTLLGCLEGRAIAYYRIGYYKSAKSDLDDLFRHHVCRYQLYLLRLNTALRTFDVKGAVKAECEIFKFSQAYFRRLLSAATLLEFLK